MTFRAVAVMVVIIAVAASDARLALAAAVVYAPRLHASSSRSRSPRTSGRRRDDEARAVLATTLSCSSRGGARDDRERRGRGGVRPLARVRAAGVDPDPHRRPRPLDHEGRGLPDPRGDRDDDARDPADARAAARRPRQAPDDRRDALRHRADADRGAGAPLKAIGRWFPYVASLLLFIFVVNIIGFIPLPLSDETVEIAGVELPTLGIYAATSSISVTLALALMTFVFTHVRACAPTAPPATSRAGSRTCRRRCTR